MRLLWALSGSVWLWTSGTWAQEGPTPPPLGAAGFDPASALVAYFEDMSQPKPFLARQGAAFAGHQEALRQRILECIALWPLPVRVPLEVRLPEALDHPWCSVRRVYYQLWPGVYGSGLFYLPKLLDERPAPAVLCPHGHWGGGNAHLVVQARCLMLAKLGYVTFSPNQNHYEDLNLGISHQTLGVWGNMRALDFLESRPEVDPKRIGVCGCSGGGLQTQMLVALDPRVKAATIVGMTCAFREILFPHNAHCDCNHFPAIMRYTDAPEISALGLPRPVQYLTMNDWTRRFEQNDFPTVVELYSGNGYPSHVRCRYEPTDHTYDRSKREQTYAWMEQWLRGRTTSPPPAEPEVLPTLPPETLLRLRLPDLKDDQFAGISDFYRVHHHHRPTNFTSQTAFLTWQEQFKPGLRQLLGEPACLSRRCQTVAGLQTNQVGELRLERILFPSEGSVLIPAILLSRQDGRGPLPLTVICSARGKDALLEEEGTNSARHLARNGALVVLPDVRFSGEYSFAALAGKVGPDLMRFQPASLLPKATEAAGLQRAWERNAIVWGRPLPAMACTDLRAVLDGLATRPGLDWRRVLLMTRDAGGLAAAALFTAALDPRVTALDVDLAGACFENGKLPVVPFILWYGDVLQWAALAANRALTLRNLPTEAGDPAWLKATFVLMGNEAGLTIQTSDSAK
jgi:dienelactone hydrolase